MTTTITHDTFDAALARVRAGQSEFLVCTYTRAWGIGAKTIAKFEALGLEVIAKSKAETADTELINTIAHRDELAHTVAVASIDVTYYDDLLRAYST